MTEVISRRHMLGLTAATIGGLTVLAAHAQAETTQPLALDLLDAGLQRTQQDRPYWEQSYSGGLLNVKPLAPGFPRRDYKPVVVPTGYMLPFKIVNGVKIFHVIAEEVEHYFKVRDRFENYDKDPGWYQHSPGTVALRASAADLARDGSHVHVPTVRAVHSVQMAWHREMALRDITYPQRCLGISIGSGTNVREHRGRLHYNSYQFTGGQQACEIDKEEFDARKRDLH